MALVDEPLYSRDAVSQYVERAPRYSERRERKKEVQRNGNSG